MSPRTGRRPGDVDTRGEILEAARARFAADGYDATSMRSVARDAGVDPALIHHYFDSKAHLFEAALELPIDPQQLVETAWEGPTDALGERIVHLYLSVWDSEQGEPLIALLKSATVNDGAARMLREFMTDAVLRQIASRLEADEPELRAALCASQIVGAGLLRRVLRFDALVGAEHDELVAWLAPTLQRYLTGPLPGPASRR